MKVGKDIILDDLGRIAIPKDVLKRMHLQENDKVEVHVDENNKSLIIKKIDITKNFRSSFEGLKFEFIKIKDRIDPDISATIHERLVDIEEELKKLNS